MKASDIFFFANETLGYGLEIQKGSHIHKLVKERLQLSDPAKGGKTLNLLRDIDRVLSLGCIAPAGLTHEQIKNWLAKHEAKKAKSKPAKTNMKASKIFRQAKGFQELGISIDQESGLHKQVKDWVHSDKERSLVTSTLMDSFLYLLDNGKVHPCNPIFGHIHVWLEGKEAKKDKRKAAKANLQNKEAIAAIREATVLIDKVLQIKKAEHEARKEAFKNGGICPNSASQEVTLGKGEPVITSAQNRPLVFSGSVVDESRIPVWGTNERVVSRQELEQRQSKAGVFANVTVEEVEAAAKRLADQMDDKALIGCTPVEPQDEQQPTEPRPFQAGDKVKVKGRTGVRVLEANPDYPYESQYPLMTPLFHIMGEVQQEKFTYTGHWTVSAEERGLPPVLELVEEEQPNPDEPKRYEISFNFNTEPSPEAKAFVEKLTKGANDASEWNCARGTLPEKGQRVVVKMANGDKNYGTHTGNGVFWVVVPLEYHDAKGVWRDYKFPYVRKWKPFQ